MKPGECWIKDSREFFAVRLVRAFNVPQPLLEGLCLQDFPNFLD